MFYNLLRHSLISYLRNKGELFYIYASFLVIVVLYAHYFSPDPELQRQVGSAVIWINMMLAFMLSLPLLFQREAEQGTLEQWLLLPQPLWLTLLSKYISHWIVVIFPILLLIPFMALLMNIPTNHIPNLCGGVLLGSISMLSIGSIGSAATLGREVKPEILILLVLPFYLPILLFGVTTAEFDAPLGWSVLAGLSVIIAPFSLYLSSALIKNAL